MNPQTTVFFFVHTTTRAAILLKPIWPCVKMIKAEIGRYNHGTVISTADYRLMESLHVIVIGTSAGGLSVLNELVNQLKPEWDASYFIVLHLSRRSVGDFLIHRLQHYTSLPCRPATDGQPIEKGHIYIGIPNQHLIVKKGVIKEGRGPEENRWRPSIDVLFRSAAAAYDGYVTGIILTGLRDDGASGMWAIKRSGGTCIVQDPNEAEYPDMPLSVLNKMEVDYCVSLAEMGMVLEKIVKTKEVTQSIIPPDVRAEAEIAEKMATGLNIVSDLGPVSVYSCPDCGGVLTEIKEEGSNRFRCHIGHAYTLNDLQFKQAHNVEATLWVALRMMEERKDLLYKLEVQNKQRGFLRLANEHRQRGEDLQQHINQLKKLLTITLDGEEP
jgi:two-component system, chemotaxis family, protein-glutamate methylesterase/glutaminase